MDTDKILQEIKDMFPEKIREIVKQALNESEIEYDEDSGQIIFRSLFEKENQ